MQKIAIIGGGGHARVLIEAIRQMDKTDIIGIYETNQSLINSTIMGVRVLGSEEELYQQNNQTILLVNGLGSTKASLKRQTLFETFKAKGFRFFTVIHPSAVVASDVKIEEGAQIMAGVVIQPGCHIQSNTILNTSCSIDHDTIVGHNSHIAPGVTISGSVDIGKNSHIGTGANIIQGIKIGENVTVAAGATVCNHVDSSRTVKGCPAK